MAGFLLAVRALPISTLEGQVLTEVVADALSQLRMGVPSKDHNVSNHFCRC